MSYRRSAFVVLFVVCVVMVLTACGSSEPCSVQAEAYIHNAERLVERMDVVTSGVYADRLDEGMMELRDIREDANGLDAPSCARESEEVFVAYFDKVIEVVEALIMYEDGREFEGYALTREAEDLWNEALDSLQAVKDDEGDE